MARKFVLVELNEVPFRVIDAYCQRRPDSILAHLVPRCRQYETFTEDKLALDPWISWPTLHRGVIDETHGVMHLGQVNEEIDVAYPPIWRLLKQSGVKVGVFGSLHSSHRPADWNSYAFYVPDYFDDCSFAHPSSLQAFQQLNIAMTRQSARNVSRKVPLGAALKFLASAPFQGLTMSTAFDSAAHLVRELTNPPLRIRRRAYQPLVMADLFLHQMQTSKPAFATFYTNHVAAAMHRYWGAAFPQDYEAPLDSAWIEQYAGEIEFAMNKFDVMLEKFVRFVDKCPEYTLLIASSMGQAAIPAQKTYGFLTVTDVEKFMGGIGVKPGQWQMRPAMVPCVCVVVDGTCRERVRAALGKLTIGDQAMVRSERPTAPMSYDERESGFFQIFIQFDNYSGNPSVSLNGSSRLFADVGLGMMAHEDGVNCTAQHVPDGSLLVYQPGSSAPPKETRQRISTVDIAPSLLKAFGRSAPSYMTGEPSVHELYH